MPFFRSLRSMMSPACRRGLRMPQALDAPDGAVRIRLRPMNVDDFDAWNSVRRDNEQWLAPWESGDPEHGPGITFQQWIQHQRQDGSQGSAAIFLIEYRMRIAGQISLGAVRYGAMRSGVVGYWVCRDFIGHGIAPTAVAMLADWALLADDGPRLHRLEIAILPENDRSRRVAEKVQAHYEGLRPAYMFVNGRWRDHDTFSLLAEDAPGGFVNRLVSRHARK